MNTLEQVRQREQQYLLSTYARLPLLAVEGKGVYLMDSEGRKYLDFLAGIAVNALGYAHPRIVRVLREQGKRLMHASNLYFNEHQGELAERLARITGMERAFFTNSGTEAVEAALKLARAHGKLLAPDGSKFEIVALENAFHGRTMGALSVTGQAKYRQAFEPLLPGVRFVPINDEAALAASISERTCAVILEGIQGEGGIVGCSSAFLRLACQLARQHQALLIMDEIQCGLGRTGKWLAFQDQEITPDIVTLAKPIASGFPLGCMLARGAAANAFQPGQHGTTFGGGPLACRLGLEFLNIMEEDELLNHIASMGNLMLHGLQKLARKSKSITEVRGRGLILGLQLNRPAKPFVDRARDLGLLVNATHETVVRLLPPYIIQPKHVRAALAILRQSFAEVESGQA